MRKQSEIHILTDNIEALKYLLKYCEKNGIDSNSYYELCYYKLKLEDVLPSIKDKVNYLEITDLLNSISGLINQVSEEEVERLWQTKEQNSKSFSSDYLQLRQSKNTCYIKKRNLLSNKCLVKKQGIDEEKDRNEKILFSNLFFFIFIVLLKLTILYGGGKTLMDNKYWVLVFFAFIFYIFIFIYEIVLFRKEFIYLICYLCVVIFCCCVVIKLHDYYWIVLALAVFIHSLILLSKKFIYLLYYLDSVISYNFNIYLIEKPEDYYTYTLEIDNNISSNNLDSPLLSMYRNYKNSLSYSGGYKDYFMELAKIENGLHDNNNYLNNQELVNIYWGL